MRLPARFEYQEPRARRDADDALAIVGDGGDHPGHFGAMPVALKLRVVGIHEIDGGGDAAAQIRMPISTPVSMIAILTPSPRDQGCASATSIC